MGNSGLRTEQEGWTLGKENRIAVFSKTKVKETS